MRGVGGCVVRWIVLKQCGVGGDQLLCLSSCSVYQWALLIRGWASSSSVVLVDKNKSGVKGGGEVT